ncbi:predicted protein [Sclerotinia sclerotiorum 1980 UF-70]|uniref:Uncharacterized protein n=1 Tax=Sclerotinia sclerotiorum (strain ATCC 18683 / 1980 / Ss-1) TaxID=665079 RepID=A7EUQ3_SCLS1|nr:predicted protein [Sclerotinia sclerotiorum 1980 UF-70]EDN93195.1 predicted protein [Sclerotinia sclerotiorum 1980 UF-70]
MGLCTDTGPPAGREEVRTMQPCIPAYLTGTNDQCKCCSRHRHASQYYVYADNAETLQR